MVKWLWELAEASKPRDGAVCIVVHGMFIDILCKQLAGAPMSVGKQSAMFCTNNAGVHAFELLVAPEGNIAGMLGSTRWITYRWSCRRAAAWMGWTSVT